MPLADLLRAVRSRRERWLFAATDGDGQRRKGLPSGHATVSTATRKQENAGRAGYVARKTRSTNNSHRQRGSFPEEAFARVRAGDARRSLIAATGRVSRSAHRDEKTWHAQVCSASQLARLLPTRVFFTTLGRRPALGRNVDHRNNPEEACNTFPATSRRTRVRLPPCPLHYRTFCYMSLKDHFASPSAPLNTASASAPS